MASSKKTSPSKSKSPKGKTAEAKIEDAVTVDGQMPSDVAQDHVVEAAQAEIADQADASVDEIEEMLDEADKSVEDVSPEPDPNEVVDPARIVEPVAMPVEAQGSRFVPLVLGGIVAGALGFMAAEMDVFGNNSADIITRLRGDLNAQQERLVALETATEIDLTPVEAILNTLEGRIAALEERPAVVMPDGMDAGAAAAYAIELETLKSSVEALLNNAKSVEQATADAVKAANAQVAITKVISAIDTGQPFPEALATLAGLDLGEIDPALSAVAADGVSTLSALQNEFPDQARTALAAARASGVEGGQQGLGAFLKRSLGARSTAPREGNDPDAVLSRAEAAIKIGDILATLTELDTLPEEAQAAIADWRAAADAHVAARAATDALVQRLTAD